MAKDSMTERGSGGGQRVWRGRQAEGAICYAVLALQAALSVETEEEHRKAAEEQEEEEVEVEIEEAAAAAATATFAPTTFSLFASKSHCSLAASRHQQRLNGFFCHFCFKVKLFRIILQCSQVANSVKRQLHKLPTNSRPPFSLFPAPPLAFAA